MKEGDWLLSLQLHYLPDNKRSTDGSVELKRVSALVKGLPRPQVPAPHPPPPPPRPPPPPPPPLSALTGVLWLTKWPLLLSSPPSPRGGVTVCQPLAALSPV